MAITPKTVVFCGSPFTGTTTSGVAQAITMPTITLPESSKTFDSVVLRLFWIDTNNAATTVTGRRADLGLNGGTKTTYNNTVTMTNSGETYSGYISYDVTAQFTSEWSGTSMTCQLDVTFTGPTTNNICAQLWITYSCDDTSATQVKTVWLPLNSVTTAVISSTKSSRDTIPALSTELPEASKTFLGTWVQMCAKGPANSLDYIMSLEIGGSGQLDSGGFEGSQFTDYHAVFVWNPTFDVTTNQTVYIWSPSATTSAWYHPSFWMIITYTYDHSTSTDLYHSLWFPLELTSPIGDNVARPSRAVRDIWIPEASPTMKRAAAFLWWQATGPLSGIKARLGTGSFVTYTSAGSVFAGSTPMMVRNDAAISSFGRGRNSLEFSMYVTNTAMNAGNVNVALLVTYSAPKLSGGAGAHSRTVWRCIKDVHTSNLANWSSTTTILGGANAQRAAVASLPSDYFISAAGLENNVIPVGGANLGAYQVTAQRDSGDGWEPLYQDVGCSDAEMGTVVMWAQTRDFFKRWPGDPGTGRNDIQTTRRWKLTNSTVNAAAQAVAGDCFAVTTFHGHTFTVAGTVSGSAGGTVTLNLCRAATGEVVKTTTRSGNGAYSFTWYDATEQMYVDAYEDNTHLGRSAPALAV